MGQYFDEANFGRWRFGTYGPPYYRLCLPVCAYLSMPTVCAYLSVLPVYAYLSIPTICACLCYCLYLPVCNLGERSARLKALPKAYPTAKYDVMMVLEEFFITMVGHTYQTANVQNSPHQNIAPSKSRPILWRAIQPAARNPEALCMKALHTQALHTQALYMEALQRRLCTRLCTMPYTTFCIEDSAYGGSAYGGSAYGGSMYRRSA